MISGDPPARNDDAVIQAIQKRLPNLFDDPISNCAAYEILDRSAKGLAQWKEGVIEVSWKKENNLPNLT